jgi:hypothetical protein
MKIIKKVVGNYVFGISIGLILLGVILSLLSWHNNERLAICVTIMPFTMMAILAFVPRLYGKKVWKEWWD